MGKVASEIVSTAIGILVAWWIGNLLLPADVPPIWPTITSVFSPHALAVQRTGSIHVCTFAHLDQDNNRCIHDDAALDYTDTTAVMIVPATNAYFPAANDHFHVHVQRKDGTGRWVTVGTDTPANDLLKWTAAHGYYRGSINDIEFNSGTYPKCGEAIRFDVQDVSGNAIGADVITFTC